MTRNLILALSVIAAAPMSAARADVVTDWNETIYDVIQLDGTSPVNKANPGWSTRTIAMMNGAIYDAFQAVDRTHAPFLWKARAEADTSLQAAVHHAAFELLSECYPGQEAFILNKYNERMMGIADDDKKTRGVALGTQIAQAYMASRANDHADEIYEYTPQSGAGKWRPDPFWPGLPNNPQEAWGPGWRHVDTFAIPNTGDFVAALPPIPEMDSPEYATAFNQVKQYGALVSPSRDNMGGREIGLFWAYDRPGMGPPPRLFVKNLVEIATQAGTSEADNARLFAMSSMAMADAAIAAWDAKFEYNFWRPVTAIHEADTDENDATDKDETWRPLGAPGANHADSADDFTPPFPAWTSGHATMGGAVFKSLELFYQTNLFGDITNNSGATYTLTSDEEGAGQPRQYVRFTQDYTNGPLDIGNENSPEGENGTSRIYLGIHWIFDQRDGITLGNDIASWVHENNFYAVPEPGFLAMLLTALACSGALCRRRR